MSCTHGKTDKELVQELSRVIADSMIELIRFSIETRLEQMLPLIKQGLLKERKYIND